jgi:transposase-like protein
MGHKESRIRRQRIAEDAQGGMSMAELCDKYDVGPQTVYSACSEYGVRSPKHLRAEYRSTSSLAILALLQNSRASESEIARRENCSREYVRQVKVKALSFGIQLPGRNSRPRN